MARRAASVIERHDPCGAAPLGLRIRDCGLQCKSNRQYGAETCEAGIVPQRVFDEARDLATKPSPQKKIQCRALCCDFQRLDSHEKRLVRVDIMAPTEAAFGDLTSSISNSIIRPTPATSR